MAGKANIPLDIYLDLFRKNNHNIDKELYAWLLFLASDDPADILRLIEAYPRFQELYAEIAAFQHKPEELVNMYSEALEIMDRNTVKYMIEEQKKELEEKDRLIQEQEKAIQEQEKVLKEKDAQLELLKKKYAALSAGNQETK